MLHRLRDLQAAPHAKAPAAKAAKLALVRAPAWPQRPNSNVLSKSIPLFFISRDSDGFWIACEADFRIGGIFLSRRSALRFAQRCSKPNGCATMILSETHHLDIENRGNRFVGQLRPAKRLLRRLASRLAVLAGKTRALGARWSRAHIEHRLLKAALEFELYRGRYKHSNKNDDDLPIVRRTEMPAAASTTKDRSIAGGARTVMIPVTIFAVVLTGIAGLEAAFWLPAFHH